MLWKYEQEEPSLHHDFDRMPNGNILAIKWEKLSRENKERYFPSIERELWTDVFFEIDYETQDVMWEWHAQEELNLEAYPWDLSRDELTHANAVEYLPKGNAFHGEEAFLVSFRHLNTILVINKAIKNIDWEFDPGVLEGQHNPTLLPNGNTFVCEGQSGHLFEVTQTGEMVWEYEPPISSDRREIFRAHKYMEEDVAWPREILENEFAEL